jgi:hypothetical protein
MASSRNTFDVKDEECLVWIKDPSVSPFIKKRKTYGHVIKREIYNEELQGNPMSILNNIKLRCFYNSALRQKIVNKIKEFHRKGTLRLYPVELGFTYSNPPFTVQECEAWAVNHLINPRTGRPIISVYEPIYMELFYTTLQYRLEPPKKVFEIAETDIFIKDVKKRLALIEEIDKYFLNEPIPKETFDLSNNVRKKHSFSVSTSSNKSLSPNKKRILTDRMLEEAEKHRLVVEHHHSKHSQRQITEQTHNANLFQSLSEFLVSLSNEVDGNRLITRDRLITYIFNSFETEKDKAAVINAIQKYFEDYTVSPEEKRKVFNGIMIKSKNQNIILKEIIRDYIRNIYSQLLRPLIIPKTYIEYLSYLSFKSHLNRTGLRLRISQFLLKLIEDYSPALDKRIKEYLKNLIKDTISVRDIAKLPLELDTRKEISEGKGKDEKTYINDYYKLLYDPKKYNTLVKKEGMRLPKGMGFITNMKGFSVDDNPQNNFTYKECEMWVRMPIFNPRTFAPIKIDSPIYYRLLCISYQYNTYLIPRMITTKGTEFLIALNETIQNILNSSGKPQTMKDLEDYIQKAAKFDAKFKIIGTTQPKDGTEIINEKMKMAFIKMASPQNGKMPFYVYFTKDHLKEFGITTELAEKSYIKIEDFFETEYYYVLVATDAERKNKKEVINKPIALPERLDYDYYEIKYKKDECENWEQFPNINPITKKRIKQDSDEYNDIFIQALHFNTNARPSNISPKGIKFRRSVLKTIPTYYDIGDCLKWIRQPKENPKTGEAITKDSPKYNEIFERALHYDSNIEPNDISRAGKMFKRLVLKKKEETFGYEKVSRLSKRKGECKDINEINSVVCDLVKNIYDGDEADEDKHKKLKDGGNYIKLKDRMIGRCQEYNTPPEVSMSLIEASIKTQYPDDEGYTNEGFDFYQPSAIASAVIYFFNIENQLLNKNQTIFSINYTIFYMSILTITIKETDNGEKIYIVERSPAADGGGPRREFLTTFFEELFCDDEHPKRPFIKPQDNIEDRYYINPNFEPDDNFKTVIEAYNSIDGGRLKRKFNAEKDYLYIYEIIGRVLTSAVVNVDIGLPQQLSRYILTGLMKQPKDITDSDLLYFYVSEFNGATMYLNMINKSQFNLIDDAGLTFNDNYVISKTDYEISKENCVKFVLQLAKHIITKNFLHKSDPNSHKNMKLRYDSLFAGFGNKTRLFLADINITIDQLNQLITNVKFDDKYLKEFADNIKITIKGVHTLNSKNKKAKLNKMRQYIRNIITNLKINGEKRDTDEAHHLFIRRLLRFWTALPTYNKNAKYDYVISYNYGKDKQGYLPISHTCFNELEIYGYPADRINKPQDIEDYIYNKLKKAAENTPGMDNV